MFQESTVDVPKVKSGLGKCCYRSSESANIIYGSFSITRAFAFLRNIFQDCLFKENNFEEEFAVLFFIYWSKCTD